MRVKSCPIIITTLAPELTDQCGHVGGELVDVVVADVGGLFTEVIAPLVGYDNAEPGLCQGGDLVAPGVPALGEAMKEENEGAILGSSDDGVELNIVHYNKP